MRKLLTFVYGLFALSATARATVQILTKFSEAPLAFLLSALAGVIYIVATIALAKRLTTLAFSCVTIELIGVVTIGAISLARPESFPDATVWSGFGAGYGYVPLVLPILGLIFLFSTVRSRPEEAVAAPAE